MRTQDKLEAGSKAAPSPGREAAAPSGDAKAESGKPPTVDPAEPSAKHHALLLRIVADEAGCAPEDIVDFELNVCDTQPGVVGGGSVLQFY